MVERNFKSVFQAGVYCMLISLLLASCGSSRKMNADYLYFQRGLDSMGMVKFRELVIQPNDLLNIQIFSRTPNQEQTSLFNLANTTNGSATSPSGYLVNMSGDIEIPVLGKIRAEGLTKVQLQQLISDKLAPYVKSPSVIVRTSQLQINVLGEVRSPGIQNFPKDRVTLIDAISSAGDLTENGKRQDVLVIREENGRRNYYHADLRNASLFQSNIYQLQQNDIVYVGATNEKLRALAINPNKQAGLQIGLTVLTVITTMVYLITAITN